MRLLTLISVYLLRIEDLSSDLLTLGRPVEARCVAGMAGGTGLLHLVEDGILVTVDEDARDSLNVPALLPFLPEFLSAPAVIMCISCGPGEFQRLRVRIGEHQDITSPSFLHDDRHQSVLEPYLHTIHIPAIAFMITKRISPMNSAVRNPAAIGMMNGMP